MANLAVMKKKETETVPFFPEVEDMLDRIRRRAYELFERRGGAHGGDVDDWLAAEREMVWSPPAVLMEKEGGYQAQIVAPGFDAKEIQVSATPRCIVVKAEVTHTGEKKEGNYHFSEFAERTLFRRIDLPEPIDLDKINATLDKGLLLLTAEKAAKPKAKSITVAA
jgi:HSP20 family molecular chaperone IbpA